MSSSEEVGVADGEWGRGRDRSGWFRGLTGSESHRALRAATLTDFVY